MERERDEQQKREQRIVVSKRAPVVPHGPYVPPRDNPEAHLDKLDALNVGETPVGVEENAWELVLKRLGHMQSVNTNQKLHINTLDALWEQHGGSSS